MPRWHSSMLHLPSNPLKEEYLLVNHQLTYTLVVGLKFEPYSEADLERIKKKRQCGKGIIGKEGGEHS